MPEPDPGASYGADLIIGRVGDVRIHNGWWIFRRGEPMCGPMPTGALANQTALEILRGRAE